MCPHRDSPVLRSVVRPDAGVLAAPRCVTHRSEGQRPVLRLGSHLLAHQYFTPRCVHMLNVRTQGRRDFRQTSPCPVPRGECFLESTGFKHMSSKKESRTDGVCVPLEPELPSTFAFFSAAPWQQPGVRCQFTCRGEWS